MFKVIDLNKQKTNFAEITTIKFILPVSKHQIAFIGFSKQSLKALQYVFEVHDFSKRQIITIGKIDFFGIKLLTDFIPYSKDGAYIVLVTSLGTKQIKSYEFPHGIVQNLHQPYDYQPFQKKPLKQYYKIHYNKNQKTIIIVEGASHREQQQIIIKVFNHEKQINNYRIIKLQSPPPCIFLYLDQVGLLWQKQFILYSGEKWEAREFIIQNIEDVTIVNFQKDLLVKFKDSNYLFQMHEGTLKPICLFPVIDSLAIGNYLYTIIEGQKQILAVYELQRFFYKQVYSQQLPQNGFKIIGCNNSVIIIDK